MLRVRLRVGRAPVCLGEVGVKRRRPLEGAQHLAAHRDRRVRHRRRQQPADHRLRDAALGLQQLTQHLSGLWAQTTYRAVSGE